MDLRSFAERCSGARQLAEDRIRMDCPIDKDHTLVARKTGERLVIMCFEHCTNEAVLAALNLTAADLTIEPPRRPRPPEPPPQPQRASQSEFSRRPQPHNLEAEQAVLGSIFIDNEALTSARRVLVTADFYRESHRTLFQGMCEIADRGQPIDAVTVRNYLRSHGKLEQTGGPSYIAELVDMVPAVSNAGYYAGMVKDFAVKRRIANDASELVAMAYNGIAADSLLGEWQRRISVIDRGFMAPAEIPWEELGQATVANEAYLDRQPVIDKLCYSSAVSMITGGKHSGKSTLARWMAICIDKGFPFLGREVLRGPVFYIASEDEEMAARSELIRLGWAPGDGLRFFGKSQIRSDDFDFLGMLTKDITRHKAVLVIVDMLFDFVRVDDEMSYAGTRRAVGQIQDVASATGAHICVLHHAPKNANIGDATVAALGSQGLAARVSPIILVRRFGPGVHSISSTSVRDPRGEALKESRLVREPDGSIQLGGAFQNYMLAEVYAERVYELLAAEPGSEMTAGDIAENLDLSYQVAKSCAWFLFKNNRIGRTGEGKKGRPFRYYVPLTDISQATENSENEKRYSPRTSTESESYSNYESQGRFGYKENEWTPPEYPEKLRDDDDLDENGISRSK